MVLREHTEELDNKSCFGLNQGAVVACHRSCASLRVEPRRVDRLAHQVGERDREERIIELAARQVLEVQALTRASMLQLFFGVRPQLNSPKAPRSSTSSGPMYGRSDSNSANSPYEMHSARNSLRNSSSRCLVARSLR